VEPGKTLVLEVMASSKVAWMFTCSGASAGCQPNADAYPGGSNSFAGASGDFGFRTYALPEDQVEQPRELKYRRFMPVVSRQTVANAPNPGVPPAGSFSNLALNDSKTEITLTVDYQYDGPLPQWGVLGVVDPGSGSTIWSLAVPIETREGTFSWSITCGAILDQFQYSSQKDAPVVHAGFQIRFSYAGSPVLTSQFQKTCPRL
jgi:hypothetical protein